MTPPRVDTEVGPLRTVVLHRPGPELERLTPRNADRLLFDGIPWVERAQLEHDRFAATLDRHGVRVLLLADLLRTALEDAGTREQGIADAVDERVLGRELAAAVRAELAAMGPDDLGNVLVGGLTFRELGDGENSLVRRMHGPDEFAVDPLPNLMFTRDSSMRVGDRVVAAAMGMPARRREAALVALAHRGHPELGGVGHTDPRDPPPSRAATCCCSRPGCSPSGSGSAPARPAPSPSPAPCSTPGWPTPCSPSRSPSGGRRCIWTRSRRWSTSTPWSSSPRSSTRCRPGRSPPACTSPGRSRSGRPPRGRWGSTSSARSTPARRAWPRSASSGTTATTPSRSPRGASWPTSGTPRRTGGCATRGSRS